MVFVYQKSLLIVGIIFSVCTVGCGISATEIVRLKTEAFREELSRHVGETSQHVDETYQMGEEVSWTDAYYKVLTKEEATEIQMLDVDYDGVPELFLSRQEKNNTSIYRGYSFKDGQLLDIKIQSGFMPSDLKLYREQETGETIWLASGMFIDGEIGRTYEYVWNQVDFDDLSNVNKSLFYGWNKTIEMDGSVSHALLENGSYLTQGQTPYYENPVFSGYELVNTLSMFSFADEFKTKNGFDKNLYDSFIELYEETKQENSQNGDKICSVTNENLFAPNQTGEKPLYLFGKEYKVLDDATETDINVKYLQVRYPDKAVQNKINEKLKSMAFDGDYGAEALEAETHVKLTICQYPSFYQNFFSVRESIRRNFQGEANPRGSESAVTFRRDTGKMVSLSDILVINNQLKEKLYSENFANSADGITYENCVELGLYDRLWDSVSKEANYDGFYLNKQNISLIVGVSPSMGDYQNFEISWEKLDGLLNRNLP